MNISTIFNNAVKAFKSNSPEIFTGLGIAGVLSTSYLVGKASFKAAEMLEPEALDLPNKEKVKIIWKCYIPAGISGSLTIAAIFGASKVSGRRTAAAVTAYSITERAFSEYKEKVVEQIGKGKEQKIRDELAQDRVTQTPPSSREVVILGKGNVLCCELFTRRYFRSDMETLRRAQNDINAKIINELYVTLDEFYDLLGLSFTSVSSNIGWDSNRLMELSFSTVLSDEGEPCLAFDYNYTKPLK